MLASSAQVSGLLRSPVATRRAAVVVRADNPRVTEGRTFREDDGQMSGKPTNASGAGSGPLYADEVARAPVSAMGVFAACHWNRPLDMCGIQSVVGDDPDVVGHASAGCCSQGQPVKGDEEAPEAGVHWLRWC